MILALVVYIYEPYSIDYHTIYSSPALLLAFTLICLSFVASMVIKVIMSQWAIEGNEGSLEKAGQYIEMLERLLVFGFVVLNQWQAIGWLIAAKSVFRFADLSKARDRKPTEYILIGTLISFGMAIFIGMLYQYASHKFFDP